MKYETHYSISSGCGSQPQLLRVAAQPASWPLLQALRDALGVSAPETEAQLIVRVEQMRALLEEVAAGNAGAQEATALLGS